MKLKIKLITAIAASLAAFSLSANAATISVNTGPAGQGIGTTATAGVVAVSNWNDKLAGNFGATAVTDDSGTLLATTVSVSTIWTSTSGAGNSTANHTLMNGGMDNDGSDHGYTIANIPYEYYNVYIYYDGPVIVGRGGSYEVWDSNNGDAVLATQKGYDTGTFSGTYILGNGLGVGGSGIDANGDAVGSNYIMFSGMTASDIKIQGVADQLGDSGVPRTAINGFQIVEAVPEPSSTALIGLGGLALLLRRRK